MGGEWRLPEAAILRSADIGAVPITLPHTSRRSPKASATCMASTKHALAADIPAASKRRGAPFSPGPGLHVTVSYSRPQQALDSCDVSSRQVRMSQAARNINKPTGFEDGFMPRGSIVTIILFARLDYARPAYT
jgi:hypothetical protein